MRFILIIHLLALSYCVHSQDALIEGRVGRKAKLFMRNPYPVPWLSPTKRSIKKDGYQLTIRAHHPSLDQIPTLLIDLEKSPKLEKEKAGLILMVYCEINSGFLKKKKRLELFNDCSIQVKNNRYQMSKELYAAILKLLPLGLREHWQKYYACFENIKID
jgi:hypothetical protein